MSKAARQMALTEALSTSRAVSAAPDWVGSSARRASRMCEVLPASGYRLRYAAANRRASSGRPSRMARSAMCS